MSACEPLPERWRDIELQVNGERRALRVPEREHLADALRHRLGLTGTHLGCEHGVCGACTVRVDGDAVRGCLMLAVQAEGCDVQTIEGASVDDPGVRALQIAFVERNALQCGYCTPGFVLAAAELLRECPAPTREQIRAAIAGNLCRCTGYQAIVDAIEQASRAMSGQVMP